MSANATGTPTANFSIPKFNTASDAPNGKGTNEMMDAIDALLLNRITPVLPADASKVYAGDGTFKSAKGAVVGVNIGAANTDLVSPTAYDTFYEIGTGGGTLRSVGTPLGVGATFTIQNRAFGTTVVLKHNTAGGTGQKLACTNDVDDTLAYEESATFCWDGTNWVEVSRSATFYKPFTPAWTSSGTAPSLGNASVNCFYTTMGKLCHAQYSIQFGTTTTFGTGTYWFSLPLQTHPNIFINHPLGLGIGSHSGTAYPVSPLVASATVFQMGVAPNAGGSIPNVVTNTNPVVWANTDYFAINLLYLTA